MRSVAHCICTRLTRVPLSHLLGKETTALPTGVRRALHTCVPHEVAEGRANGPSRARAGLKGRKTLRNNMGKPRLCGGTP